MDQDAHFEKQCKKSPIKGRVKSCPCSGPRRKAWSVRHTVPLLKNIAVHTNKFPGLRSTADSPVCLKVSAHLDGYSLGNKMPSSLGHCVTISHLTAST